MWKLILLCFVIIVTLFTHLGLFVTHNITSFLRNRAETENVEFTILHQEHLVLCLVFGLVPNTLRNGLVLN